MYWGCLWGRIRPHPVIPIPSKHPFALSSIQMHFPLVTTLLPLLIALVSYSSPLPDPGKAALARRAPMSVFNFGGKADEPREVVVETGLEHNYPLIDPETNAELQKPRVEPGEESFFF